jgi:ABC-2 type transport system permease protein
MIARIARKELTELARDGRLRWALGTLVVLLAVAAVTGWQFSARVAEERRVAQAEQRLLFEGQGEKNPHSAAHYGIYVFKPELGLAAVDRGLDPYIGVSLFLEAHRQNLAQYRPAADATPAARFGALTAATTLQLLVPLFIILLTYGAVAGEREHGTLRLLLSLGVRRRDVALGKALGTALPLLVVLVPLTLLGVLALAWTSGEEVTRATAPRLALMTGAYLLYFTVFIGLGLVASAAFRSSRLALVVLLGFWFVNGFLAPRVFADLGRRLYPTPSAHKLMMAIAEERTGHVSWAEFKKGIEERLMAQYGVSRVEDLPVNPEGVALEEGEARDTEVFERHLSRIYGGHERQQRFYQAGALVAPLLAVQAVSMAAAGTDLWHHRHFAAAAEQYRIRLISHLNADITHNQPGNDYSYRAGRDVWESAPAFEYSAPSLAGVLGPARPSLMLLLLWCGGTLLGTWVAFRRLGPE